MHDCLLTALVCCVLHVACVINLKIAIKRELGMLRSTLLTDYSYPISKAMPPCTATPTSACSIVAGMKSVLPVLSQQHTAIDSISGSKCCLSGSGKLRPLSLPKPTIILPFSHSKTMTILKDGHMKPVPYTLLHVYNNNNNHKKCPLAPWPPQQNPLIMEPLQ